MVNTRSDKALLRLAEQAVANGWPPATVSTALMQAMGHAAAPAIPPDQPAPETGVSEVVLRQFARPEVDER